MSPLNAWQKHSRLLIYGFLGLAALCAAFLMYKYYLKPSYQLTQFVPQNYQISFEYKNDRFTFPPLQQKKLLANPMLADIYQGALTSLNKEIDKLPANGALLIKKSRHAIVFWQDNFNYGVVVELNDEGEGKQAEQNDFSPWQKQVFKKQILLLASSVKTLNQMIDQKIKAGRPAYLSLTISPWLTVKFKPSFFEEEYDDTVITSLQMVLTPLKNSFSANFRLEVDSDPYALIARLLPASPSPASPSASAQPGRDKSQVGQERGEPETPNATTLNTADLGDFFKYLPQNSQLIIGLSDFEEIPEQLQNNPNFKRIWAEIDGQLWISQQLSLTSLLKNARPPVIISWSPDRWQIATKLENRDLAEYYLKNFLGQFEPKEKTKILPDGSRSIELIADPGKIVWQKVQQDGWTVFTYPKNLKYADLGLAIKGDFIKISNRIGISKDLGVELRCSVLPKSWEENRLKTVIWLNPKISWLRIAENLKKFNKVLFSNYQNGEIDLCLGI